MKVLKYGEGYPKTTTCGYCNSELEYESADTFRYAEKSEFFECVKCPVCGKTIEVGVHIMTLPSSKKKEWWQYSLQDLLELMRG